MRKVQGSLAALILLLAVSVGPAPGQDLVTPDRIGRPDANITITWQSIPVYSLQNPFPTRKDYLLRAAEDWVRKHPNVKIVPIVSAGGIFEAMTKLLEQAANRRAPDVAQIDGFFLPRFFPALRPLNDILSDQELNDFIQFARAEMTAPDGTVRALRFTTDVRVLYYRKDLVPAPPETWDEVIAVGSRIAKEKGIAGFLYPAGRDEGSVFDTLLSLFWGQGGELVDRTSRPIFNEGKNREAMLNVLSFFRRTVESGATPGRVVNIKVAADINQEVAAGRVAMFIGGNWQVAQLKDILKADEFAGWDVTFIPQIQKGQRATAAGGWGWGFFTRDPEKLRLAVDFVKALYVGVDGMANWTKVGGYLPTRSSVYQHTLFASDPLVHKFREMLTFARTRPGVPIYTKISEELQVAIGDVVTGAKTPERALDAAWQNVMSEYQRGR
jgi:multiple sugar transport system substrate-binding protein